MKRISTVALLLVIANMGRLVALDIPDAIIGEYTHPLEGSSIIISKEDVVVYVDTKQLSFAVAGEIPGITSVEETVDGRYSVTLTNDDEQSVTIQIVPTYYGILFYGASSAGNSFATEFYSTWAMMLLQW